MASIQSREIRKKKKKKKIKERNLAEKKKKDLFTDLGFLVRKPSEPPILIGKSSSSLPISPFGFRFETLIWVEEEEEEEE